MSEKHSSAPEVNSSGLRTLLWIIPILTATVVSKLAIPPFGAQGIGIALPILLFITAVGFVIGQFKLATDRLIYATVVLSLLCIMQALKNDLFFMSSLALLIALHLPFVLQFRRPVPNMSKVTGFFHFICAICACCGILQFALQPLVDKRFLFPLDNFVPDAFLVQNYNEQAPLEYGSTLLRSNGVFMMEPSYLSQLLAIALVIEMVTRSRWWLLILYLAGMIVSYSGTGLMILAVCVPIAVIVQRRWGIFILFSVIGAIALAVGEHLYLDSFLARVNEFNSTGSSGFARFVGGFYLFDQYLWDHPLRALFGTGAGMFKEYAPMAHYPVVEMPLFKMVLEFGIIGALAYFSFLFFCLSTSTLPTPVALAVGMTFILNGLYVPFSHAISLSLLIWTSVPRRKEAAYASNGMVHPNHEKRYGFEHRPLTTHLEGN